METLLDPGRRFVQERASVEEWVFISDEPSDGQNTVEVSMLHSTDHSEYIPVTPRVSNQFTSLPWETAKPQDMSCFWERIKVRHGLNATSFIHVNSDPFLSVWYCRFQQNFARDQKKETCYIFPHEQFQ